MSKNRTVSDLKCATPKCSKVIIKKGTKLDRANGFKAGRNEVVCADNHKTVILIPE